MGLPEDLELGEVQVQNRPHIQLLAQPVSTSLMIGILVSRARADTLHQGCTSSWHEHRCSGIALMHSMVSR